MGEIFVSYAREDAARVELLAHCLENHGWVVFWDRRIPSGKRWHEVLSAALARADWVIAAWSTTSVKSEFVRDEAQLGLDRDRLLPVLLDDVRPPLGFGQVQAANFTAFDGDESSAAFQELLRDLGAPGEARRSSTAATSQSIPELGAAPQLQDPVEPHAAQEPETHAAREPQTHAARGALAHLGMWPAVAGAVAVAAALVVWLIARSSPPTADPAPATTGAAPVATQAASQALVPGLPSASPGASSEGVEVGTDSTAELETERVLGLLRSYYHDLNGGTFQASKYFAATVTRFITMQKTTPEDIDAYVNGQLPKSYSSYRAEMDEASLVRTAPRTFEYRETTHVVEKDKPRSLVAKVHVQMVPLAHISPGVQAAKKDTEKARPHTVVVWRLSTFETYVIPRMFPDLAKKGQQLQKAP